MNKRILEKIEFISDYKKAQNAASGSKYDPNANVSIKNVCTLGGELHKKDNIDISRKLMYDKITELFDEELAQKYLEELKHHIIYAHDETAGYGKPYCASITMYPYLFNGMKELGGDTSAPTNIDSYCGSYINLVFAIAAQLRGAIATPEVLMYMDYFLRKAWGEDYYNNPKKEVEFRQNGNVTIEKKIQNYFQQIVYSINQPAAARDYQSIFLNWSIFDKYYFTSMFEHFVFPDGTHPKWESLEWLQEQFMLWFNKERTKAVLTFPVMTAAILTENNQPKDTRFANFVAKSLADGNSFFMYMSDSADSLSSCCRLRNEVSDNTFSYSLGAGGVSTGSVNVITINLNRVVQQKIDLKELVHRVHKYQVAYRAIVQETIDAGLLQIYDAGFINLKKQYSTIGINGLVEAAEFLGISPKATKEYSNFVKDTLGMIAEENKKAKTLYGCMFNTEMVPAENLAVKNAKWDKADGLVVPERMVYNSYFYIVEDKSTNILEKFKLHGKDYCGFCDGGSALHLNLSEHLDKEQYLQLLNIAATEGCNYWTVNVRNTECKDCGHISKHTLDHCPICGSTNLDYLTRVIGYLKRVSSFSAERQEEEHHRHYH